MKCLYNVVLTALIFSAIAMVSGCNAYKKQIVTGKGVRVENVYANPYYDHSQVLNVLLLPVENTMNYRDVEEHRTLLTQSLLRNFSRFHYFHLQYDPDYPSTRKSIIDLNTGSIDRVKMGAIGKEYNADAFLKMNITEYRPFFPMLLKVKAVLVDANTGERIWSADQIFDVDEAEIYNSMRLWWNTRMAGGDASNRFNLNKLRPGFFANFVFYRIAESYGKAREENVAVIESYKKTEEKMQRSIDKTQEKAVE